MGGMSSFVAGAVCGRGLQPGNSLTRIGLTGEVDTSLQPAEPLGERLKCWKEIATYVGCDARTVQRWEREEGFPVHRLVHKSGGTVYAFKSEIEAWRESRRGPLEQEASRRWRRLPWAIAVAAVAALLVITAVWLSVSGPKTSVGEADLRVVPLTTYPGDEASPDFSPDGSQVAFAWRGEKSDNWNIYVKVVDSGPPLRLTSSPDWDLGSAWSPDGRRIAFCRRSRDRAAIYLVSPLGGPERLLTELSYGPTAPLSPDLGNPRAKLSWSPDGKLLAVFDRDSWADPFSIWLLAVDTGTKRRLTSPPSGRRGDRDPAFSPGGQTLAFVRWKAVGNGDLHVVSVAGGEPTRLTFDHRDIDGLTWTPDGREILFASTRGGLRALWKIPASGGTPERVRGIGTGVGCPAISRRGNRLVYEQVVSDTNIWRAEASETPGGAGALTKLIASTRYEDAPEFSPDGRRITFSSGRSGNTQVWVCNSDGSNPVQLTWFEGSGADLGRWSPDGQQIAFNSKWKGNWDIYVVSAQGGASRQLTADPSDDAAPVWSRDGRWIYFASNRSGADQLWKAPAGGGIAVQVTKNGGRRPVMSPDGRFVYFKRAPDDYDIWRAPVEGGEEVAVLRGVARRFAVVEQGIYFYGLERGKWFIQFFDFQTGRTTPVAGLEGIPVIAQEPTVSPDRRSFLYVQEDLRGSDLMLVENFR